MARRKGTSRVSAPQSAPAGGSYEPGGPTLPSMRERRPVMFWTVIVAVAAMVLSTVASFISAFL